MLKSIGNWKFTSHVEQSLDTFRLEVGDLLLEMHALL